MCVKLSAAKAQTGCILDIAMEFLCAADGHDSGDVSSPNIVAGFILDDSRILVSFTSPFSTSAASLCSLPFQLHSDTLTTVLDLSKQSPFGAGARGAVEPSRARSASPAQYRLIGSDILDTGGGHEPVLTDGRVDV